MNYQTHDLLPKKFRPFQVFLYSPIIILFFLIPLCFLFKIPVENFNQNINHFYKSATAPLVGAPLSHKPSWSINEIIQGEWQKKFESWFNEQVPFRIFMIRFHNQMFYQMFSKIFVYHGEFIIGKKGYLYSSESLNKYCNTFNINFQPERLQQWSEDVQKISNFFKKRGQNFIYIITPSKASYLPENFPENYDCSTPNPRADYIHAKQTLDSNKINYIDATQIILNNKPRYGNLLFAKGGGHWTNLGGAIVANELIKKISMDTKQSIPKLNYSVKLSHTPLGKDVDVLETANLLFPEENYLVPEIMYNSQVKKNSNSLNIAFVGDSFSEQIIDGIQRSEQFGATSYYFYFIYNLYYPTHQPQKMGLPVDPTYKQLFASKIVVLEENESCFLQCKFTHQLADLISSINR